MVRLRRLGDADEGADSASALTSAKKHLAPAAARVAMYDTYMAPRAQYVRLPRPLSGSSGSGGSRNPVSSLFSTGGRSPNPTLSAKSRSFLFNNLARRSGFSWAMAGNDAEIHAISVSIALENRRISATRVLRVAAWGSQRTPGGTSQNPGPTTSIDDPSDSATRFVTC